MAGSNKSRLKVTMESLLDFQAFHAPPWSRMSDMVGYKKVEQDEVNKAHENHALEPGKLYALHSQNCKRWVLWPQNPEEQRTEHGKRITAVGVRPGAPLLLLRLWPCSEDEGGPIPEFLVGQQKMCCYWYNRNYKGFFLPLETYDSIQEKEEEEADSE